MRIMLDAHPRLCPYFGKWLVEGAVVFDYGDHAVWQSFYSQADFDSAKEALTRARNWFDAFHQRHSGKAETHGSHT